MIKGKRRIAIILLMMIVMIRVLIVKRIFYFYEWIIFQRTM